MKYLCRVIIKSHLLISIELDMTANNPNITSYLQYIMKILPQKCLIKLGKQMYKSCNMELVYDLEITIK